MKAVGRVRWQAALVAPLVVAAGFAATASAPTHGAESAGYPRDAAWATRTQDTTDGGATAVGLVPATPPEPLLPRGTAGAATVAAAPGDPLAQHPPASVGEGFVIFGDGPLAVPELVFYAYRAAEMQLAIDRPECALPWTLLAAIGRLESEHAHRGKTDVLGTLTTPAVAPDGRTGPMQLPPAVWQQYAADGNADGAADPQNVFDATLAAGSWLCSVGGSVRDGDGQMRAVALYDPSPEYLGNVREWSEAYRRGAEVAPAAPVPVPPAPTPPATSSSAAVDVAAPGGTGIEAAVPAPADEPDAGAGDPGAGPGEPEAPALPELPAPPELPCLVPALCE